MWLGGARKGSIWLCYAGPLAERQKTKADSLGEEQLGKLGEEEDEEEEPETERRRKYTDLGLDLGEREEQAACHVSVLALAITDEARWDAEM